MRPPSRRCRPPFRPVAPRPVAVIAALALFAIGAARPDGIRAQGNGDLEVIVTDSLGRPLEGAHISLDRLGLAALTDSSGHLRLLRVPAGQIGILVQLFGFHPESSSLRLAAGRINRIAFALHPAPIPVGGVHVAVTSKRKQMDFLRGFTERRERGIGYFLTREDIEESGTSDLSNLLHMVPGLRTSPSQFGQTRMRAARTPMTRQCEIKVYVDGMKYRNPNDVAGIPTSDIEAIEIYRGRSELPAEFADLDTNCGAIVIWSRRHREL